MQKRANMAKSMVSALLAAIIVIAAALPALAAPAYGKLAEFTARVPGYKDIHLKNCVDKVVVTASGEVQFFEDNIDLGTTFDTKTLPYDAQIGNDNGKFAFGFMNADGKVFASLHNTAAWESLSSKEGVKIAPITDYAADKAAAATPAPTAVPATPAPTPEPTAAPATPAPTATPAPALSIALNGVKIAADPAPFLDDNNRTMVPLRFIGDALGAEVGWDKDTQTATVTSDGLLITVKIGSNEMSVEALGAETVVVMDTVAVIKESRTFVPLRFIAEALGLKTGWDGDTRSVLLTSEEPAPEEAVPATAVPATPAPTSAPTPAPTTAAPATTAGASGSMMDALVTLVNSQLDTELGSMIGTYYSSVKAIAKDDHTLVCTYVFVKGLVDKSNKDLMKAQLEAQRDSLKANAEPMLGQLKSVGIKNPVVIFEFKNYDGELLFSLTIK